ncbi:hypothetical protein [Sphingomonas sp. OK281]|uniref:hypothetical protein n=1 Tax=Sphingomonas sp. OK281 TaxID=1881067 RepID=UPI0008F1AE34|nr:hypothetical protein [Sphingomonas sp. OK281]SFO35475.1 hypothetical protein SAMN05428984_3598 [Sphingomonas sp. OK281]
MKKFALILAFAALAPAVPAFAHEVAVPVKAVPSAVPVVGKMLYSTGGKKLAAIYKLDAGSAPQILLDGKLITVPSDTLSDVDGHIETSLTKKDLMTRR